jgi:hypothetical protein
MAKKRFPWVEVLVIVALLAIIFSVVQPNFSEYDTGAKTALCRENQHNIEQAVALWLASNPGEIVERGIGEVDERAIDAFGEEITGMLHYADTHPNAAELVEMGLDPTILYCPEVGDDGSPLGSHYCYKDTVGTLECAVDAEGKARLLTDKINPNSGELETSVSYFHK